MPPLPNAPTLTPPPLPGAEPLRVLVVDDEPTVRTVARLMLERSGYAVEEANDSAAAVARLRAGRSFAVVLLDVTLPDRAGTELLSDVRALAPTSRVVLTSGKGEEDFPDHGADGYLPKPFTKEQLLSAVRAVIGLRS